VRSMLSCSVLEKAYYDSLISIPVILSGKSSQTMVFEYVDDLSHSIMRRE
jgi:hypothetical protein